MVDRIDIDKCIGCGTCVKKCPTEVFSMQEKKAEATRIDRCMACRYCEVICPVKTIKVIEK